MNAHEIERLAEAVVRRVTVEIEASGRHVHLSRAGVDQLFGVGYRLNRVKDLSQPGQFVCAERVSLVGPKGELKNVVVLGPERGECQAEVSLTDAVALGCKPPVRLSGEIEGTPGITLRHIHMTPVDAGQFGVRNGQSVRLKALTARPLTFGEVEVRVSEKFSTVVHLDYDEANACGFQKGDRGLILS